MNKKLSTKATRNFQKQHSLKWDSNGELSALDMTMIYQCLATYDPQASSINHCAIKKKSNKKSITS
tara:strand:+ start:128 stop:325 length:198 start_codon:yes stop_codon:yes gene_type:complete